MKNLLIGIGCLLISLLSFVNAYLLTTDTVAVGGHHLTVSRSLDSQDTILLVVYLLCGFLTLLGALRCWRKR